MDARVRYYQESDEPSWLRCRALGFLDTAYFDDVWREYTHAVPGLSLVGVRGDQIIGICSASPAAHGATIDTVVVHPDHRRTGLGTALLRELLRRLKERDVALLDAWTRDDEGTVAWYQAMGFEIAYRYLHVYASGEAELADALTASSGLVPRSAFFHADTQDPGVETELRQRFGRVHACQRFVREP